MMTVSRRFRTATLLIAGLCLAATAIADAQSRQHTREFASLVDRYLVEVMGINPPDAGSPPDLPGDVAARQMSAAGFAQRIDTLRSLLRDLQSIDRNALEFDDVIDHRFLEGTLRADLLVAENVQRWRQALACISTTSRSRTRYSWIRGIPIPAPRT